MIKRERLGDLAAGGVALVVYLLTLAPTITWRNDGADSGDLVSAAFTLGIPHPTGYPLYTLFAAFFSHLPFGEPAKNVNVFSAFASAAAIVLICIAGRRLVSNSSPLARWIPASLALVYAFAPALWSQATIAEVNALAILLIAALFVALFSDSPRRLFFAAAIFGLGLAHHVTIMLLAPSAVVLIAPTSWTRSQLAHAALALIAPLVFYLYLPLSALAYPPINWGDPKTLDGFLWVVSGAPYRPYFLGVAPGEIFSRLALTARFLFEQFTLVGVGLGLWGAAQMATVVDSETRRRFLSLFLGFGLIVLYAVLYASRDSFVYLLPAFLIFVFWMMYGVGDLLARLMAWRTPVLSNPRVSFGFSILFLLIYPFYNLVSNCNTMNLSSDYEAYNYAQSIFADIPREAVVIADGDEHLFALEYYRYAVAQDRSVAVVVSAELLQYSWYFDQVRRMMPSVNASHATQPERLVQVVNAGLAQGRGVYATLRNEWFLSYAMERRNSFYRVLGRVQ